MKFVALLRDNQQLLEADPDQDIDSFIHIYSANGLDIGKIEAARDKGIIDCKFWDNGLVAMTSDYQLIAVDDFREPKPHSLAECNLDEAPSSWAIIPPHLTLSHHVEVLLSVNSTILIVDSISVQDQFLNQGPFSKIAISPNGRLVALCTSFGLIQVVSSNFEKSFSESTPMDIPPNDAVWCGTDAVVAAYDSFAALIGPFGDILSFEYDSRIFLVQEMDGVRIFTNTEHDFLYKVPESSKSIFQIGSTSPGALLYDAYEHLTGHSSKTDEIVRSIKHDLASAVDACIAAAGHESLLEYQQSLLRAASFGKSFITVYNGDKFVDMCRHIRLLNTFNSYDLGIPITLVQYVSYLQSRCMSVSILPLENWIDRLINRNQHLLAIKICDYLDEPRDKIYIHWACSKIRSANEEEDKLYHILMEKLSTVGGISYFEIAEAANDNGYSKLAVKLLKHEPKAGNQVPLLLSMNNPSLALEEAIISGDADLVYFVILHLYKTQNLGDFFHLVSNNIVATRFFEKYCREQGSSILEDFYFQNDAFNKSTELILIENLTERDPNKLIANLKVIHRLLSKNKSHVFEANVTSNEIKLLNEQRKLEQDLGEIVVGKTLNETVFTCVMSGQMNKASKIRSEFGMSEKTFYWIKLRGLVQKRDWTELDKFSRSKKPPIGFKPFASECIKALQYTEAEKYISKCDPKIQPQLYIKIGRYNKAFEASLVVKDYDAMRIIASKTQDTGLRLEIESRLNQAR
ncbi:Vacuolar protein [Mycoemilia scoparia]|uniref:Vacuolar protein n=1 Tax=Mycoemilia scoparia TaxID=417184 RepID=A0A9W8AA41_9FUNG|nr:Vacuolar protein [Mycoemilia scoparia]